MATLELSSQWHPGEEDVHRLLHAKRRDNPTYPGLAPRFHRRIVVSPLVAFGTLDQQGRPWITLWGGEAGFCRPIADGFLGVNTKADAIYDPVLQELFAVSQLEEGGSTTREIVDDRLVKPEGGKVMAGLAIDLETRDRVKVAGRFVAGAVTSHSETGVAELQMAFEVQESLGNCPKYLNKKHITPYTPRPELISQGTGLPLPPEAVDLLSRADLFFISSKHGGDSMDVNHRGGSPGFARLFRNEPGSVTLVYPEFSGNGLYQTLGNLQTDACAGLVVPDFETGNVLYLTGRTTTLIGDTASAYLTRTKVAVKIDVEEARFVKDGLPFRGKFIDYSPYNPAVRRLTSETDHNVPGSGSGAIATATLTKREIITPTIARLVFKLSPVVTGDRQSVDSSSMKTWQPGQHVTLDFAPELDHGYAHMNDDDPQSLNDDFVRSFTISAPPDPERRELQLTVRRNGPATGLLFRWNLRVPLEVPVLTYAGSEEFRLPVARDLRKGRETIFVTGGVGITPLMAQARMVLDAANGDGDGDGDSGRLRLLWSLRAEDVPLAVRVFEEIEGLDRVTTLFVTGEVTAQSLGVLARLRDSGVSIEEHRIWPEDLLSVGEKGRRTYYCCTGASLLANLSKWLEDEHMVYESFNY